MTGCACAGHNMHSFTVYFDKRCKCWPSCLSDVLPPLRKWFRALSIEHSIVRGTHFRQHFPESRGFSLCSPVSSHRESWQGGLGLIEILLFFPMQYAVSYLTITNRGDCCSERLSNFEIRIGNSLADNGNRNPNCGGLYSLSSAETRNISCPAPIKGRYVNIRILGEAKILTLCEVEVYAKGNRKFSFFLKAILEYYRAILVRWLDFSSCLHGKSPPSYPGWLA